MTELKIFSAIILILVSCSVYALLCIYVADKIIARMYKGKKIKDISDIMGMEYRAYKMRIILTLSFFLSPFIIASIIILFL